MMLHQVADHLAQRRAGEIEPAHFGARGALRRALVGLLAGMEFGIHEKSVFQIIDADGRGFTEADRTEMAGDFDAEFVRFIDGSL